MFEIALSYEKFDKLPEVVKALFIKLMKEHKDEEPYLPFVMYGFDGLELCESPIEQQFLCAFLVLNHVNNCGLDIEIQEELNVGSKTYRPDFIISNSIGEAYNVVIECDGHDFHEKTKQQVIKGNNRDYDLKLDGYEVLHFSGSEIFKDAVKCASKAIEFVKKRGEILDGDI